jgi:hypothetical protein
MRFQHARTPFIPDKDNPKRCPACKRDDAMYHVYNEARCEPVDCVLEDGTVIFNVDHGDYWGNTWDPRIECQYSDCNAVWDMPEKSDWT